MTDTTETVATFERDGDTYEIDHLGICRPEQHGEFAVYRAGDSVAEFAVRDMALFKPGHRQEHLPATSELIELAVAAIAEIPA